MDDDLDRAYRKVITEDDYERPKGNRLIEMLRNLASIIMRLFKGGRVKFTRLGTSPWNKFVHSMNRHTPHFQVSLPTKHDNLNEVEEFDEEIEGDEEFDDEIEGDEEFDDEIDEGGAISVDYLKKT
jgi:hypothetical protein